VTALASPQDFFLMADQHQDLAFRAMFIRDEAAWDELFKAVTPRLYGLARKLGVPKDKREDLLHATWARLLKVPWRNGFDFASYALKTLRNLAIDVRRADRRRPLLAQLQEGYEQADERATPLEHLLARERADHICACLDQLTEQQQTIIRLHYGEERMPHAEIGKLLDLSESQVRNLCYRAVLKLLELLEGKKGPPRTRGAGNWRGGRSVATNGGSERPAEKSHDHA
jgi:RNA polymerase sigma factor (sigma-70 family)